MGNNPIIEVMGPNEELRKNGSFLQCWRSQPQKCNLDFHATSTTSKGLSENSKKMSWHNSIGFFVQFFLGLAGLVGDSDKSKS